MAGVVPVSYPLAIVVGDAGPYSRGDRLGEILVECQAVPSPSRERKPSRGPLGRSRRTSGRAPRAERPVGIGRSKEPPIERSGASSCTVRPVNSGLSM